MPTDLIEENMLPLATRVARVLASALIQHSEEDRERVLAMLGHHHIEVLRYGGRVALIVGNEPVVVVAAEEIMPTSA